MTVVQAFIAIGSNINPAENVLKALRALIHQVQVVGISTFYFTEPVGRIDQASFYNGVLEVRTEIPPETLKFQVLRKIEKDLGRRRTKDKYSPRTIDLDLILYGNLILKMKGLVLPDPEIFTRQFLAFPLYELVPDLILPPGGKSIVEIIQGMTEGTMKPLKEFNLILKQELNRAC
ncbi:MAG: 2-amino-4-hydroxy-6-hydroxymethyldihydropteridine diphosphokinase [Candidatus Riflebacteria bacterium]|nr:2-amino-4-hydroxy-6-hydroxymethyldihydropteridine diphosphokinase [Candidatus Riflebacteria bacterium]